MNFSERVKEIVFRVNAMSLRERALILLAVIGIVVLMVDTLLTHPVRQEAANIERQIDILKAESKGLDASIEELTEAYKKDPDLAAREALARTQQAIKELDARLGSATNELLEPRQMIDALRDVLASSDSLTLNSLRSLGAEPVIHSTDPNVPSTDAAQIFRHRVQLKMSGQYLDVLDYLKQLEGKPWKFFWERINLSVTRYPEVEVEITVYTLGLKRGWLGV